MMSRLSSEGQYRKEAVIIFIKENLGQLWPVYRCYRTTNNQRADHFVSLDENCDNWAGQNEGLLGYVSKVPIPGIEKAIYRCYHSGTGDHMVSSRNCEGASGYTNEGLISYVAVRVK